MSDKSIDTHFDFLKNLDTGIKKHLIEMLWSSLNKEAKQKGVAHLYGAWDDDRSTELIINEIRGSRVDGKPIRQWLIHVYPSQSTH